jgi:bifunctional non-homologous end joining protein LigD
MMAVEEGHEGIVAKDRTCPYLPGGRTTAWSKVVRVPREEFVVVGWVASSNDAARPGALVVASRATPMGALEFAGLVGRGIGIRERELLHTTFLTRHSEGPTALDVPPHPAIHHVVPNVVVEIAHDGTSIDHLLRSPRFLGIRPDRDPNSVVRDPQWS